MKIYVIPLLLFSQVAFSQKLKKGDRLLSNNLKAHITFLADDKLQGRRTGTEGEKMAYLYIQDEFKKIGLLPKGDSNSYIQSFTVSDGKQINPASHFIVDGNDLQVTKDFFPLQFSANAALEAMPVMAFQEKNMPWFLDIKATMEENKSNPHFDITAFLQQKANELSDKGATAMIVYNSSAIPDNLAFEGRQKADLAKIPVIYVNSEAIQKYLADTSTALDINLKVDIGEKNRTGHNVAGYIDNGAENTIVIGGHYDHLGYGEDNSSLWKGGRAIHNGADDNASGTAAVIELARMIQKNNYKKNNYLFVCFSAEELGLIGSKYFTEHPTIDMHKVDYMLNIDMIGRLNDSSKTLLIGGYGTSPSWAGILPAKDKSFSVKFDSSGVGPSDHTSFYRKDIPVLFFFTGVHNDYHKPGDDVDKINFNGEVYIIKYIYKLVAESNQLAKLPFSKTKEQPMGGSVRFSVTLGIMPDYSFNGKGVRADGIVDGKIAQQVGIKEGDIITAFDEHKSYDLTSYMDALSKYKKGDAAVVTVIRGTQQLTFNIVF